MPDSMCYRRAMTNTHRWMHEDDMLSCLTCGATYRTDDDGEPHGRAGQAPTPCSGDTQHVHGAVDESGHDLECAAQPMTPAWANGMTVIGCEHCTHECNCALCNG